MLALLLVSAFLRLYRLDVLPPGIISDIATNGLDARAVLAGHLHVFFAGNNGREAFFIYFQALLMAFGGVSPFIYAYSAVAMAMLTIALTYRLFRSMFGVLPAWLASMLLSASFWSLALSRVGLRSVSLPPFEVATLYFLWRLLRTRRRRYAWLAGAALGGTLYTYLSGRLLPVLVVLLCLAAWRLAWTRWRQLAVMVVVSVLVFAPEGWYFARHPQAFLHRAQQVSVFNTHPEIVGARDTPLGSLINTAGMFFIRGDANPTYNIPGRPVLDPLLAIFFIIGLAGSLWLARTDLRHRWLLLWLVVMSLPSVLSHESPDTFRIFSVAPVVFLFPALGVSQLGRWLRRCNLTAALAVGVAVWSVATSAYLYFGQWAHQPSTDASYDGGATRLAAYIAHRPERDLYFSYHVRWPVQLLQPRTEAAQWYDSDVTALPLPEQPGGDVLYTFAPSAALSHLDPGQLPALRALPHSTNPAGKPDFLAFSWPGAAARQFLATQRPLNAAMTPDFDLKSYGLRGNVLSLVWKPLQVSGPYDLYVHVLDASGKQLQQSDLLARPPADGPINGYLLLTQHVLSIPPGSYTIEIGAVHRSAQHPEQVQGGPIGQPVRVPVTVGR